MKTPLEGNTRKWDDNINMDLKVCDLQTSKVTQRVMAGQCEHGNVYLVEQRQ